MEGVTATRERKDVCRGEIVETNGAVHLCVEFDRAALGSSRGITVAVRRVRAHVIATVCRVFSRKVYMASLLAYTGRGVRCTR